MSLLLMTENSELPIECPYCPINDKKEFFDAKGVDSHFVFSDGHPNRTEDFKRRIRTVKQKKSTSADLPKENEIKEYWVENNYPNLYFTDEVPVQLSTSQSNFKYVDIVMYEDFPFQNIETYYKKAIRQGFLDPMSGRFVNKESQVQFILQNTSQDPLEVRIFEIKRELNFKSIGQILSYSEFFPEYYSQHGNIEVVEKGIIYAEEDKMCFKLAERYGISLHPVDYL